MKPSKPSAPWIVAGIVAVLAHAALPAGAADVRALREQSDKVVPASGIRMLQVGNARGFVSVRAGASGQIRVSALKVAQAGDETRRRQLARETRVEARTVGDRYVIQVKYPQRTNVRIGFWDLLSGKSMEIPRVHVRLTLEVPADLPVELDSSTGDLMTDGLSAHQRLETTSGDIEIGTAGSVLASTTSGDLIVQAAGRARLSTTSGDVDVARARGATTVSTTSGEITVGIADDSLTVSTASGDVEVGARGRSVRVRSTSGTVALRAGGTVDVETASGDAELTLLAPLVSAAVSTVSGDVTLHLGGRTAADLDLKTTSGTLDVEAPLDVRSVSRQRLTGVVRGGAAPVRVRSTSGDVHISD